MLGTLMNYSFVELLKNGLEIAVLAFAFYYILVIFRGTRSEMVLYGGVS
ncbi:MAG: hypothetical protein GX811_03735, partial [Lentisphaerae bacterium]|nr:hypothetical protein [Lentisphaerota bacterium]